MSQRLRTFSFGCSAAAAFAAPRRGAAALQGPGAPASGRAGVMSCSDTLLEDEHAVFTMITANWGLCRKLLQIFLSYFLSHFVKIIIKKIF